MRYVAFLRGINVGGRIVKMADLKACFETAGLEDVKTILQTGNVLFSGHGKPKELRSKIEAAVSQQFGYAAKIQVYKVEWVEKIINAYPFDASTSSALGAGSINGARPADGEEEWQHYVIFLDVGLAEPLSHEGRPLDKAAEATELGDGVIYWRVKKGATLDSPFAKFLTKAKYKDGNTVRNIKTLKKIIDSSLESQP